MKVQLDIESCKQCPFWKEGPTEHTDSFDSGNDWICTHGEKEKYIAGFVEWHDHPEIPSWCPIKIKTRKKK